MNTLGIFAKHPVPGRVKTRLAVELGNDVAARAAEAFVLDLAVRFQQTADRRFLCYAPDTEEARGYFRSVAAVEYFLWPQPEIDLGGRMERFFREHLGDAADRVVIIGSDSPTLPREFVERAFELLGEVDCVLGPATDGGYYLIGMRGRCRPIFSGIEWSGARVLDQTVGHVEGLGATLALLPPWYDVDTVADWQMLRGHLRGMELAGQGGVRQAGGPARENRHVENAPHDFSPAERFFCDATRRVLGLDIEKPDRAI